MRSSVHVVQKYAKRAAAMLFVFATITMPLLAADDSNHRIMPGRELWQDVGRPAAASASGADAEVRPNRFRAFALNHSGMSALFPRARAAAQRSTISIPSPNGGFQRFAIHESEVMEAGLAAKHPEIKTYSGRGIDDPRMTIHMDMSPIGFHASVRGPGGAWFIDPYYRHDQSVYVSYYGRDLKENTHGPLVEGDTAPGVTTDRPYYPTTATVELSGGGFAANSPLTITISDPSAAFTSRTIEVTSGDDGNFTTTFAADTNSNLGTHQVDATDGNATASVTYDVVDADAEVPDPPVGDQLRTYRLALLTDNSYANYFGAANVTAAKVTLINRVSHVYETETSIKLVLIANNDLLNLNTAAAMTGANGPCGGAPCFTASQAASCVSSTLTRNRQVIGLLVGASSFDVGHIALGVNGGGVASLGVVGLNGKAQGCTGIPTPVGDFFAVDYVAHEMGHQFAGNHTFNGTQSNCSGGNRNAGTSVEPGSGSSIMAYAGICQTDNLQPHSDPYWSQRSFDEIVAHTSAAESNIAEVQMGVLTTFDANGKSFQLQYNGNTSAAITRGTNYTTAGVKAAIEGISGIGATVTVSALSDTAFTVTFAGTADWNTLQLVNCSGCTGYVGEIAKGGITSRRGNTVTPTGNNFPTVTVPAGYTIPVRTPFVLTGSATDPDNDPLTYMWEQNDRAAAAGTGLVSNTKLNGPLFRQFGVAANVTPSNTLLYESPGENLVDSNPTRVFPDMAQILANRTNADTGVCATSPADVDCFSEFLPTAAYVGFGSNANPASLHFRLTARDGRGGVNTAQTTLTLASASGPFLVTSPNTTVAYKAGSTQTITWDVAGTSAAPVSAANVKITLSADGGNTYPYVLAASTANDGVEAVTLPVIATTSARVKIEAVGNIFFDISNSNFAIQALPVVSNNAPAAGAVVQYSDALAPAVTISATDADSAGATLTANATGLPAGLSLAVASTSGSGPGARTWTIVGNVTDAPGSYNAVVTVTDDTAGSAATSFTIIVNREDAEATYTGDMLAFTAPGGSSASLVLRATVRDSAVVTGSGDSAPGVITNASVTFKEGATTLCTAPVALLGADTTTGTASCSVSFSADVHTITVIVNNFYTGSTTALVQVAQPDGSFITGGGFTMADSSGGAYKADAASAIQAAYNVKYNKNGKNLQGQVNIRFQSAGKSYQVKSTAMDSLGVVLKKADGTPCTGSPSSTCFGVADFRSKANLNDVSGADAISIAGNLSLQMTVTDKGEPGRADSIGITVWNGSTLVFSSKWTGVQTVESLLAGGNAVVH
jgi:hypothetical protein